MRLELAHREVGPQRLAVVGQRDLELGRDRALGRAGVALRREAPAEHRAREGAEVGRSTGSARRRRRTRAPRRTRAAGAGPRRRGGRGSRPARTSAGAETTRPVGWTKPSHSRCARTSGSSLAIGISSSPARGRRGRPARRAARAPRRSRGSAAARVSSRGRTARGACARSACSASSWRCSSSSKSSVELCRSCFVPSSSRTRSRWRSRISRRSLRLALAALAQLLARRAPASSSARGSSCGSSSSMSRAARREQLALGSPRRACAAARRSSERVEQLERLAPRPRARRR